MKLSVVLAAYNEEKLIGKCLEAILNQDYPKKDFEVIVVDNNSTDRTSEIVRSMGIEPILYDKKQGAIHAKQYAVKKAKGEIVAVTDADSAPSNNWLKSIEKQMESKEVKLIGGKVSSLGSDKMSNLLLEVFDRVAKLVQVFGVPLVWGSNMAVRKSAFEEVDGFNTKIATSDDWEFTMRIQKKFGVKSVKYTDKLKAKVSPRKLDNFKQLFPYFTNGLLSFITIFIFRKTWMQGSFVNVR